MESQPLVSIGVPVYNGGKYLEECLNSILVQTYQNWQCIIVDNCSTDNTNLLAQRFVASDNRFHLIVNKDFVDQTANWNITFSKISRESVYFKIVCADDWIFPEYLEKMVAVMERYPSTGVCSSYRIDGVKVNCDRLDYYDGPFHAGKKILLRQLFYNFDVTGSVNTVLYRMDILKKTQGYPQLFKPNTYHIDTELVFQVLNLSDLGFVHQVLSYTRRHNETYTSQISDRFKTSYYFREQELHKYLNISTELKAEYKKVRHLYALFLLKMKLKGEKDCIAWHRKYLKPERYFTLSDYAGAILFKLTTNFSALFTK